MSLFSSAEAQGHGVLQALRIIDDLDALARFEQLAHIIGLDRLLCLHDDGLRVSPECWDTHSGAGDLHVVVQAEDLLQLPGNLTECLSFSDSHVSSEHPHDINSHAMSCLHLLLRVAILLKLVDLWDDLEVAGRARELGGFGRQLC